MPAKYQSDLPVNRQYQLIKLAWSNYQSAPEALDPEPLEKVEQQAKIAEKIMTAVLASAEAQKEEVIDQEVEFIFEQLKEQFDSEESFDLDRVYSKARKLCDRYGITCDPEFPVPHDDGLADRTFRAAIDFVVEVGAFCPDTGRNIRFT